MAARNLQLQCESCAHADEYGRGCALDPMAPILLLMTGRLGSCPEFKPKTLEQLKLQDNGNTR